MIREMAQSSVAIEDDVVRVVVLKVEWDVVALWLSVKALVM